MVIMKHEKCTATHLAVQHSGAGSIANGFAPELTLRSWTNFKGSVHSRGDSAVFTTGFLEKGDT